VANLALGAAIVAPGEALRLGESLALERKLLLDALADSPIGPIVAAKRANVESKILHPERYAEGGPWKDLRGTRWTG
jgi:hypothetical protein